MKQYKGAVFFVDMLGIGALTRKSVELCALDFETWGISKESSFNEHVLCAKLLMKFRSCLTKIKNKHKGVKVAQLSDCAFIWSEDHVAVALAAQDMMWASVGSGLLCRGGIAYGDIVEPNRVAESLGLFVLGEAATKAVEFEGRGKGCRVYTDDIFAHQLSLTSSATSFPIGTVSELRNPLTGEVIDEFRWYLRNTPGQNPMTLKSRHKGLLRLISMLLGSPHFTWNASSSFGQVHLACSIESLSAATRVFYPKSDVVFSADHVMHGGNTRSIRQQQRMLKSWWLQAAHLYQARKKR
jgi:hypothetical protein